MSTDPIERRTYNLARAVVVSGWVVCIVTAAAVLACALALLVQGRPLPDPLREWAGIVLGFLFGTFVAMVRDFIEPRSA